MAETKPPANPRKNRRWKKGTQHDVTPELLLQAHDNLALVYRKVRDALYFAERPPGTYNTPALYGTELKEAGGYLRAALRLLYQRQMYVRHTRRVMLMEVPKS